MNNNTLASAFEGVVLTRYLYVKSNCFNSLYWAILDKKEEESLFWAFEIYFSGFSEDLIHFIRVMYMTFFRETHPEFEHMFMFDFLEERQLGTIIKQCTLFTISFTHCLTSSHIDNTTKTINNVVYSVITDEILSYNRTVDTDQDGYRPWKVLKVCCEFPTNQRKLSFGPVMLSNIFGKCVVFDQQMKCYLFDKNRWLYYAYSSPIWKDRIHQYHGSIDQETNLIAFPNDTYEEDFFDKYGYEPDEQSNDVQNTIWPTNENETISACEFINKYGKANIYKTIKIRVRKSCVR